MTTILRVRSFVDRSTLISLAEVERLTNAPRPEIERLLEEEIVQPASVEEGERLFTADEVRVIERCLRLHDDLGVNWAGIAIIERLLHRIQDAERRTDNDQPAVDVTPQ